VFAAVLLVPLCIFAIVVYRTYRAESVNRDLLAAAHDGDVAAARAALDAGADPNSRGLGMPIPGANGPTTLLRLIRRLIGSPAQGRQEMARRPSVLHLAEQENQPELVRLLLDRGADPNIRLSNGMTPLMQAAGRGQTAIVNVLIEGHADINASTKDGSTALMFALRGRWADTAQALRQHGATFLDGHGNKQSSLIALLGSARKAQDRSAALVPGILQSMLILAAEHGAGSDPTGTIEVLLAHGADVNAQTPHGETALIATLENRWFEAARLLILHGADVNKRTSTGETALMDAASPGFQAPTVVGHQAVSGPDLVRLLIARGANVNVRNNFGQSPLSYAAESGSLETLNLLLAHGAAANIADNGKSTPLINVALYHNQDTVEIARSLLRAGADVNAISNDHQTALSNAIRARNRALVQLLRQAGARK
jgi:ankyrin repeat protein